jgi:hypothetical protein
MTNIWIYRVECDFCGAREDLYNVDLRGPEFYHACMSCIRDKGWDQE